MDVEQLEQCAQQGAKLLLLCSPHNPVGRVWQPDELASVLDVARRYQLVVFSDEIHADLIYAGYKHTPLATLAVEGDRVMTAVSPSKTFNLAGLGLSALIISDASIRREMVNAFAQLHIQALNPFSLTAYTAAYQHGSAWRDALMSYLRDTRDAVISYLVQHVPKIRPIEPEGTYLMWLDCRALGMSDAALRDFFVRECGLGLNAGAAFGRPGSGFIRLNLASPRLIIMHALERMHVLVR
jgi:cystathionine beta-lyase